MDDESNLSQVPTLNNYQETDDISSNVPNISGINQADSVSNQPLVNTPTSASEQMHVQFAIDEDDDQPNPSDNFAKLFKGNKFTSSTTKKSTATSSKSNHQRRYEESIKSHCIAKQPRANTNTPSLLKISGQKIIGESLTLIRPMKCFQYDTPEAISPTLPSVQPNPSPKRSVSATNTLKIRQQLQKRQLKQISMMQNNITVGFNTPEVIMTKKDMKQMQKDIAWIEKRKKLAQDAKNQRKNQQIDTQGGEKNVYLSLPPAKFV